ncbi:MAG: hypothetical protein AAF615_08475 [Pseudomonadota bacterium]
MAFEDDCANEAVRLHEVLEDWLIGRPPRTAEAFHAFSSVIGKDFVVISPKGTVTEYAPLLEEFESLHGQLAHKEGAFRISVKNFRPVRQLGEALCATYEEWHELDGKTSARLSTAIFGPREGLPHGAEWLHIHETWLPGLAPTAGERFPE